MIPKRYYLILDIETTQRGDPFNIAFAVMDKKGQIIESNDFIIDEFKRDGLFSGDGAFSPEKTAQKLAILRQRYKQGLISLIDLKSLQALFDRLFNDYQATLTAYNLNFDSGVLGKHRIAYNGPSFCLWELSLGMLCHKPRFLRQVIASRELTPRGMVKTNAEVVARYACNDPKLVELHLAYDDVLDEAKILAYILRQKKRLEFKRYNWREWTIDRAARIAYS
jgi:hypothetical protein